ncbi:MAG: TatD family hydrolase [Prolixibacteraceae bacterium]
MIPYIDLHTHGNVRKNDEIKVFNLLLNESSDIPLLPFSAGLHPWYADQLSVDDLSKRLNQCLQSPDLFAIGETGLDKVCKTALNLQLDIFECQLKIASENNLPVIIHCVRAWEELIEISGNYHSTKILHGYQGGVQLTERLLKKGFCFSIGKAILNSGSAIQSSIHLIPKTSLFCETDTSVVSIKEIYEKICAILKLHEEDLRKTIFENYKKLKVKVERLKDKG